jgi:hypothetical protein
MRDTFNFNAGINFFLGIRSIRERFVELTSSSVPYTMPAK